MKTAGIPESAMSKLKAAGEELRLASLGSLYLGGSDDVLVSLRLADVADDGLNVQPGVKLSIKLYTDVNGVGGCDATSSGAAASSS